MNAAEPGACSCCARVVAIRAEMDALDKGLIDVGLTAATALQEAAAVEADVSLAYRAAGLDDVPAAAALRFADG
jgi:hypothetical protein